jgi:hypothetical protein
VTCRLLRLHSPGHVHDISHVTMLIVKLVTTHIWLSILNKGNAPLFKQVDATLSMEFWVKRNRNEAKLSR